MIRVSVIVPTFNCRNTIRKLIESLIAQEFLNYEIIIVDSSNDGTDIIAKEYGIEVIKTEKKGISAARNIGVKASSGDILCFIDGDCWTDKWWVKRVVDNFKNPRIGCVGGPVIVEPKNLLSRYMNETIVSFFPRYDSWRYIVTISQVANQPFGDIRLPVGCNMAFRREALESIDGFDEDFIGGYEEFDVMINLLRGGWYILVDPEVKVYHEPQTSVAKLIRKTYNYGRGAKKLIKKHKLSPRLKLKRGIEGIFKSVSNSVEICRKHKMIHAIIYPVFDIIFGSAYYLGFTV